MKENVSKKITLHKLASAPLWPLISILLIAILISYSNTFYSPFALDDFHSFINDPKVFVKDFSVDALRQLSSTKFGIARLIPIITFAVDHHLFTGSIAQYHITNIIIHILTTLALLFFLRGLLRTQVGSRIITFMSPEHFCFFVCALWALHPVQTNAVTYLVQRMTSLAALFYLLSLASYIYGRISSGLFKKSLFYLGFGLAAISAFLSKQISATLPISVLLVEFMFICPELGGKVLRFLKWYHWLLLAIGIILLLPLLERPWDYILNSYRTRHFTIIERLLTESRVLLYYVSLLILPLPGRMNLEHDFSLSHSLISPPTTVIAILLLTSFIISGFLIRKRYPLIAFGIFWFLLNLVIESTVLPLELVFEHRLYLPSVGYFIALAGLTDVILKKISIRRSSVELKELFLLAMIIMISLSSILTSFRNNDWRDSLALYHDCLQKSPRKPRAYLNYGSALGLAGRHEEAVLNLEKAIELGRPGYASYTKAANNIMASFVEQEDYEEVIRRGEKYLRETPPYADISAVPKILYHLGNAYKITGRYTDAYYAYHSGLKLEPIADNLYMVIRIQELFNEAYDDEKFRTELLLDECGEDKKIAIPLHMSRLMLDIRDYEKAKEYLDLVFAIVPENSKAVDYLERYRLETTKNTEQSAKPDIRNHKAYKKNRSYFFYLVLSDFILKNYSPLTNLAEWFLITAQKEEPGDPFASLYLARLYLKKNDLDSAIIELEKAVQIHPDFIPLLELSSRCYLKKNELDKVDGILRHMLEIYPGYENWKSAMKTISHYEKSLPNAI